MAFTLRFCSADAATREAAGAANLGVVLAGDATTEIRGDGSDGLMKRKVRAAEPVVHPCSGDIQFGGGVSQFGGGVRAS